MAVPDCNWLGHHQNDHVPDVCESGHNTFERGICLQQNVIVGFAYSGFEILFVKQSPK